MFGQRVSLDWNVGDAPSDATLSPTSPWNTLEWDAPFRLLTPENELRQPEQHASLAQAELWQMVRAVGIFCLALLLMTSTAMTPDLQLRIVAQEGIQASLELEKAAWQSDDKAVYTTLIDQGIELRWINEWRDLWRLDINHRQEFGTVLSGLQPMGNLVEAQVTITRPSVDWWRSSPYSERRFYRQTEKGWLRTLPDDAFWGAEQTLEGDYIIFTFTERDRANVLPIAAKIERIYLDARRLMNLQPPSQTQKLHITVTPEMIRRWYYNRNDVLITSPMVSKIPLGMTEADFLAQTLADLLAYRAIENASVNGQGNFYQWGMMIWGMSGWLRSDLLGERSPWDEQANAHFHELGRMPMQLEAVTNWQSDEPPTRELLMAQYVAAESIVDYVATTYGREQLPLLLDALSRYRQWDTLISELFGLSRSI